MRWRRSRLRRHDDHHRGSKFLRNRSFHRLQKLPRFAQQGLNLPSFGDRFPGEQAVLAGVLVCPWRAGSRRTAVHAAALFAAHRRRAARSAGADFCPATRARQHRSGIAGRDHPGIRHRGRRAIVRDDHARMLRDVTGLPSRSSRTAQPAFAGRTLPYHHGPRMMLGKRFLDGPEIARDGLSIPFHRAETAVSTRVNCAGASPAGWRASCFGPVLITCAVECRMSGDHYGRRFQ